MMGTSQGNRGTRRHQQKISGKVNVVIGHGWNMSEENLLSIAGLLSFFLGTISLYIVYRSNHLKWNEKAAGYILSWIFLVKAIAYPCDAYAVSYTHLTLPTKA